MDCGYATINCSLLPWDIMMSGTTSSSCRRFQELARKLSYTGNLSKQKRKTLAWIRSDVQHDWNLSEDEGDVIPKPFHKMGIWWRKKDASLLHFSRKRRLPSTFKLTGHPKPCEQDLQGTCWKRWLETWNIITKVETLLSRNFKHLPGSWRKESLYKGVPKCLSSWNLPRKLGILIVSSQVPKCTESFSMDHVTKRMKPISNFSVCKARKNWALMPSRGSQDSPRCWGWTSSAWNISSEWNRRIFSVCEVILVADKRRTGAWLCMTPFLLDSSVPVEVWIAIRIVKVMRLHPPLASTFLPQNLSQCKSCMMCVKKQSTYNIIQLLR